MLQKCSSGHIEATQIDVVDIVRKLIHTGNTIVEKKRKTAAKGESQFVVKQENFDDDPLNALLADTFIFDDDKDVGNSNNKPTITTTIATTTTTKLKDVVDADVVGKFKNTEEEVVITVNNKVTTCEVDIEICCEIVKQPTPIIPTTPTTPTTPITPAAAPPTPKPVVPKPPPKCGVRNEDGLIITAKDPSEKEAR